MTMHEVWPRSCGHDNPDRAGTTLTDLRSPLAVALAGLPGGVLARPDEGRRPRPGWPGWTCRAARTPPSRTWPRSACRRDAAGRARARHLLREAVRLGLLHRPGAT